MFRFKVFGIPVEVQPFFWIVAAMLGGASRANSPQAILAVLLFMLAAFVSVLIHELGHATVGTRLGGGYASIVFTTFGGLAYNHGGRFTPRNRFWMIAAGPGAGFVFFLMIFATLSLSFDRADVWSMISSILFGTTPVFRTMGLLEFIQQKPFVFLLIDHLLWINFWWGVINLLPIMPLDGGQITNLFVRPQRNVFLIGTIAAGGMALLGYLWMGSIYTALLFGYFAWKNYQSMKELHWQ